MRDLYTFVKRAKVVGFAMVLPFILGKVLAQPAASFSQAKRPLGSMSQLGSPYKGGQFPTSLPQGKYDPGKGQFGVSQHAYLAYLDWKSGYTQACSDGTIRVLYDDPARTVSEGIAYGMLLAAYAADKTLFDGLWNYYKKNSVTGKGIMGWNRQGCTHTDAGMSGNTGATDAELDAAMALLVAACQWPDATNPFVYSTEATNLIQAIKTYEIHPTTFQTLNGDSWGSGNTCRNPSYFSPAYYKLFARHVPADSTFWANEVVDASYELLNANRHPSTGLVSNWSNTGGVSNACNGPNEYGYDACRNPWRMATDVLWHRDPNATGMMVLLSNWLSGYANNCAGPIAQNAVNPTVGEFNNVLFASTWAMGAMGGHRSNLVKDFYNRISKEGDGGYFGTTLKTIALFFMTGNFWNPYEPLLFATVKEKSISQNLGTVNLQWTTEWEQNVDSIEVYFSADGLSYTKVSSLKAGQTSYGLQEIRYINLTAYYQLRIKDTWGNSRVLETISVNRFDPLELEFYPNPTTSEISLFASFQEESLDIEIRDAFSRKVDTWKVNAHTLQKFQVNWPSGMYYIGAIYQGEKVFFKLQIQ
ncbi:MAG: glycosyl hydrolase family 8 [Cytophagaceae bacterium]|jgi:endo-1,4-beta-D-glucanase Y|nr:glycosyl hydrolase family 8 [Cytophagaceae bacterium]